jgi:hypothetical protein
MLFPDLEYRVRAIGLTLQQAIDHNLPSTPLKPTELRAAGWIARFGCEQTEIDALMALAPGALEAAVSDAFAPYFDRTLADRAAKIKEDWQADAQAALDALIGDDQLDDQRARFEAAIEDIKAIRDRQDAAASGLVLDPPELPEADPATSPRTAISRPRRGLWPMRPRDLRRARRSTMTGSPMMKSKAHWRPR